MKKRIFAHIGASVIAATLICGASTTFAGDLNWGMSGAEVMLLQQQLQASGYLSGAIDGVYGDETANAVKAFQAAQGLYVDGIAGAQTVGALGGGQSYAVQTYSAPASTPATYSNNGDLQYGMRGSDVTQLQQMLAAQGYNVGSIDGVFGSMTVAAAKAFQADHGLYVDGIAGKQTINALMNGGASASVPTTTVSTPQASTEMNRMLQYGSSGNDVAELQRQLAALGYNVGTIDGSYGSMTAAAVKAFQNDRGLYSDGIAGNQTIKALTSGSTTTSATAASVSTPQATGATEITRMLQYGSSGNDVAELQRQLAAKGYDVGTIDGSYGSKTAAAVKAFQEAKGLYSDGIAGAQTVKALTETTQSSTAKPASTTSVKPAETTKPETSATTSAATSTETKKPAASATTKPTTTTETAKPATSTSTKPATTTQTTKTSTSQTKTASATTTTTASSSSKKEECEHLWVPTYTTVHHDAITHEEPVYDYIWHEAVTHEEQIYQEVPIGEYIRVAVCDCGKRADEFPTPQAFADHCFEAGCGTHGEYEFVVSGYEQKLIGYETVIDKDGYLEEVVDHYETYIDVAEWDEQVENGYRCSICGATK